MPARPLARIEKTAARRVGLTVDEYRDRIERGQKFCTDCKAWHPLGAFGRDSSRSDGLASRCRESKQARQRAAYLPVIVPVGRRYAAARNGDARQARRRLTHLIEIGQLPHPSKLACVGCGHVGADRQHVYRHPMGFAPEHHETVETMCSHCDPSRRRSGRT